MARNTRTNSRRRPANAKLNMKVAQSIRSAAAKGNGVCELARKYKVHHSTIQAVIANRTWR